MRSRFDEQLVGLNRELIKMASMCEEAIALSAKALTTGDTMLAEKVVPLRTDIDRLERDIESDCMKLLLQQQPVARDLRQISAALKMVTDIERIGDQAADIAEIAGFVGGRTGEESEAIGHMSREVIYMVTSSVDAFSRQDTDLAEAVIKHDDVVDACFTEIKRSLIDMISQKPGDGEYALDLLMTAKYLERIGDHAVNIAQWVLFSVTGVHRGEA